MYVELQHAGFLLHPNQFVPGSLRPGKHVRLRAWIRGEYLQELPNLQVLYSRTGL
jgi:hypothetical protein